MHSLSLYLLTFGISLCLAAPWPPNPPDRDPDPTTHQDQDEPTGHPNWPTGFPDPHWPTGFPNWPTTFPDPDRSKSHSDFPTTRPTPTPSACPEFLDILVNLFHEQSAVESYCASYLHYTTPSTVTVSKTVGLLATTNITSTVDETASVSVTTHLPNPTVTSFTNAPTTTIVPPPFKKRNVEKQFSNFKVSTSHVKSDAIIVTKLPLAARDDDDFPFIPLPTALISQACSCFATSFPTPTVTITVDSTSTITDKFTISPTVTTATSTVVLPPLATVTTASDYCAGITGQQSIFGDFHCSTYNSFGQYFPSFPATSLQNCCDLCFSNANCGYGSYSGGSCTIYLNAFDQLPNSTSTCPMGVLNLAGGGAASDPTMGFFAGPCGSFNC